MVQPSFSDKDRITDALNSQKYITDHYNNFANESGIARASRYGHADFDGGARYPVRSFPGDEQPRLVSDGSCRCPKGDGSKK